MDASAAEIAAAAAAAGVSGDGLIAFTLGYLASKQAGGESKAAEPFVRTAENVVLVTGGTGLVGQAIREVIEAEANASEQWIFLGSRDGGL